MKSFLNYSKNRFLYGFFKILIIILLSFFFSKFVHAETIDMGISDLTLSVIDNNSFLDKDVLNFNIKYWEENLKNDYPYFYIAISNNGIFQFLFSKDKPFLDNNGGKWNYYQLPSFGFYSYNFTNINPTIYEKATGHTVLTANFNRFFEYYFYSNFDLIAPEDLNFTIKDKTYNIKKGEVIPPLYNIILDFYPDFDKDDGGGADVDLSTIYIYLTLICVLLLLPILMKFIANMFNVSGSDYR